MRNFLKVAEGVDVIPLLNALATTDLWNEYPIRTTHPGTAHAEADDILVWFNDLTGQIADDREVQPFPAWDALPQLRPLVFGLMQRVDAIRLGRVIITRLAPGKQIYPHADAGAPATYFDRYQIALQSLPGANFQIGEEQVNLRCGEVWWINNEVEHSVVNNSADDRIVVIVDVRRA